MLLQVKGIAIQVSSKHIDCRLSKSMATDCNLYWFVECIYLNQYYIQIIKKDTSNFASGVFISQVYEGMIHKFGRMCMRWCIKQLLSIGQTEYEK